MAEEKPKRLYYGYVIVFCCALVMFINVGLVLSCAGIFFGPVSTELAVPVGSVGLFLSFNFIFSALTLSVAGKMMERFGARRWLTASSLLMGMPACDVAVSCLMAVLRGRGGFRRDACLSALSRFPDDHPWFKKKVGFYIGICSAGSGIGGVIFNPVAGCLIAEYGWRTAYAVFGAIVLTIVTPVLGIFLRNDPAEMGLKPYGEEDGTTPDMAAATMETSDSLEYREILKMPIFYGLFLFAFLMNATAILFQYIPQYAGMLNFSLEQASFAAAAAMIGATVGKIALGMINDKSIWLGLATTIGQGIVGLVLMLAVPWRLAVQTPLLVRAVFGRRNYAQVFSNISIAFTVAGAVAATTWGFSAEQSGYSVILLAGIGLLIISGVIGCYALKTGKALKQN